MQKAIAVTDYHHSIDDIDTKNVTLSHKLNTIQRESVRYWSKLQLTTPEMAHFLLEISRSSADNVVNTAATLSAFGYRATLVAFLCPQQK